MTEKKPKETAPAFKLVDFLKSDLFTGVEKDLLPAVLEPDKEYTLLAVEMMLRKEKERKVIE